MDKSIYISLHKIYKIKTDQLLKLTYKQLDMNSGFLARNPVKFLLYPILGCNLSFKPAIGTLQFNSFRTNDCAILKSLNKDKVLTTN